MTSINYINDVVWACRATGCDTSWNDDCLLLWKQGAKKKEQGKRMKFVYNPTGKDVSPPKYMFRNHSGDEIK